MVRLRPERQDRPPEDLHDHRAAPVRQGNDQPHPHRHDRQGHVANPTLSSLGAEFGLAPLLGKSLAVIGDARLGSKTDSRTVIERLLSISGEDAITVNCKFRDQVSVRLPTRFMIISNELPAFGDSSGAIASRFVITTLTRSFLGKENIHLEQALLAELPGILNWALVGLDRISRQPFTVPVCRH